MKSSFSLQHSSAKTPRSLVALARASYAASLLSALLASAPLAAQQAPRVGNANATANAYGNADTDAPPGTANDRLRGAGEEDSLLGGPAAYRDPYRSALDAGDAQPSNYAPLTPDGRARGAGAGAGGAGGANTGEGAGVGGVAGNAPGGNAAPNAERAGQSLYRTPFGGATGNGGQVYRSPW